MKRISGVFDQIVSIENLQLADERARRGKKCKYGIQIHDRNREFNLSMLKTKLENGTYRTSEYHIFKMVTDNGKEREIYRLPYYPDRIMQHAVMNILSPLFVGMFIRDTYSCIQGRGIHDGVKRLSKVLYTDPGNTQYCLKLDIKKFYPSVDNDILKMLLRRKFKDSRLLSVLDEVIDSAKGLPIGNYLSQYLANFYLTYFDHWLKEKAGVKYYFRYCDDMVILSNDKEYLHVICNKIDAYLSEKLNLTLKGNYQVFPVASRGIDFLGYVFYHDKIRLRKSIKKNFARKMRTKSQSKKTQVIGSYKGWCKYGNCANLYKKITGMKLFSELGIKVDQIPMAGEKIKINRVVNKQIEVVDFELNSSKFNSESGHKCLKLQIRFENELRVVFTGATMLVQAISKIEKTNLPFMTIIVENNGFYTFT